MIRRGDDGRFGPLHGEATRHRRRDALALRPAQSTDGRPVIDFRLGCRALDASIRSESAMERGRANGRMDGKLIEVSSYSLAGFYGVISGMLYAANDVEWVITGRATGTNIDIETIVQHLRKTPSGQEPAPPPFQGTAALDLTIVGRGITLGRGRATERRRRSVPGALGSVERHQSWPGRNAGGHRGRPDPVHRIRRAARRILGRCQVRRHGWPSRRNGGAWRFCGGVRPCHRRDGTRRAGRSTRSADDHAARAGRHLGAPIRPIRGSASIADLRGARGCHSILGPSRSG